MKASYALWRSRLAQVQAGVTDPKKWPKELWPSTEPTELDVGCYRLPIKERKLNAAGQSNGQWKTVGFHPVMLGLADGEVMCQISHRIVGEDERNEAWTSFVRHPITEEVWRAVAERGEPWPDFNEIHGTAALETYSAIQAARTDVLVEEAEAFLAQNDDSLVIPPQIAIKQRLDALKAELAAFPKIESDEQSSAARGLQARFLELRGEAAGHYEEANRPLLEQQKALRAIWFPLRDEADEAKTKLGEAMGAWEDVKREAVKRAEAETKRLQEQAARDAEWKGAEPGSIAKVDPEHVAPGASNAPPPSSQIKAPGARAAKVKLQRIVTEIDVDKAFAQFKAAPEVREVLMSLAQRAVTAGLPVDGATIQERSKVS